MTRSIAILVILGTLAFASATPAAPVLQHAPATENAEIRVSVSELAPDRSYWATIVPIDAAPGAYDEFLHVAGAETAELGFAGLPALDADGGLLLVGHDHAPRVALSSVTP